MARKKAPQPPAFTPAETRYGDNLVAKTYLDQKSGNFVNQYFPDPAEAQRKSMIQQKMDNIIPTLGQTPSETAYQYQQTENAFVNDAQKTFASQYDPALRSLKEDVASRFGSLNSSQFIDDLNSLENTRASAFADIANKGRMLNQDLVNQNEARKLREVQTLGGMLNAEQSNFLNNLQAPLSAAKSINDFKNTQWVAELQKFREETERRRSLIGKIVNVAASVGMAALTGGASAALQAAATSAVSQFAKK